MEEFDPLYRRACSEKTIQSDKNGFFAEFYEEIHKAAGYSWLKSQFAKYTSDQMKIRALFTDPEICDIVMGILEHVQPVFKEKDAAFSAQRRIQAEKFILMGEFTKSLTLLNQAVIRAPPKYVDPVIDDGFTLALAYWARSGVLLCLGEGERAMEDLKLATINGFNTKQKPEYFWRQTKAYALMGEEGKAKISLSVTEKLLEGITEKIDKCRQEFTILKASGKVIAKKIVPIQSGGKHSELKGASQLVRLAQSPEKGRYIEAGTNIKTGDIVLVEEPIAACLLPTMFGTHCHHCFARLYTPVGCPNCSGIAFCSNECMLRALSSYHQYECQFLDLLIGSGMSILCYIALRIFTQSKNADEALKTANELVANLCTHSDSRSAEDYLQRALMAAFLVRVLQKSNFFGRRPTEAIDPTEQELQAGTALLGLLQLLQFNAHEIYETVLTQDHRFDGSKIFYVGAGIYRTGSYFNHDCCPSVARYFVGKSIVLACSRPIKTGEPVSENYGPIVTEIPLKERQKSLYSRYWFKCTCHACRENWPTLNKIDKNVNFKCTTPNCAGVLRYPKDLSKDVRCSSCRKNISLQDSVKAVIKSEVLYREAAKLMQEQNTEGAIDLFKEAIDTFHQVAVLPHKDTLIAQKTLRTCLADSGNVYKL